MRVLLVPVADRPECAVALEATLELAAKMKSNIVGCHIRPHRRGPVALPSEFVLGPSAGMMEAWQQRSDEFGEKGRQAAKKLFSQAAESAGLTAARKPHVDGTPVAIWVEEVGSPEKVLPIIGPASDMIVVSRPATRKSQIARLFLFEALMQSHRPVLILPKSKPKSIGKRIAVGWNQSPEAIRAIHNSLPLLKAAESVTLVRGGRDDRVAPTVNHMRNFLLHHGVKAEIVREKKITSEQEIIQAFENTGADMVVMGAYSKSRLREFLFGGVTDYMINQAKLPVVMMHE